MKSYLKLSYFIILLMHTTAYAQIVTDGSMGAKTVLSGNMLIPQSLGSTKGSNLFHSFQQFDINANESATFTGDNALKNVISRVTGGQASQINGLLKSTIGQANFYFINPAGVTFNSNTQIDVPAAFYVSTADTLRFSDGNQFNALNPTVSSLSVAEPSSFGFINNNPASTISIKNSNLAFKDGNTVSLSSHHITLDNSRLTAKSGTIQMYATGNIPTELPINAPVIGNLNGDINVSNSNLEVSGDEKTDKLGGQITVQGGNISFNNSFIDSNTYASGNAGTISIIANDVLLSGGHLSTNAAGGTGNAGNIIISTNNLNISNGYIESDTYDSTGNAGNILISSNNLTVLKDGFITSNTYASGKAGSVSISSDNIKLSKESYISSNAAFGTGNAGNVSIIGNNLTIEGSIEADTDSDGHAGNISISANDINVLNGGRLVSRSFGTYGSGHAGNIAISANTLSLLNQGLISSNTQSSGLAGNITINANNMLLDGYGDLINFTGITSDSTNDTLINAGNGGNIAITANSLTLLNEAQITSDTYGSANAGNVTVKATNILADGQGNNVWISSDSLNETLEHAGNAGNVSITANNLSVSNGGLISSETWGTGNAGNITITGSKLNVFNAGQISTTTLGAGNAGNIIITNDQSITAQSHATISSSTSSAGSAGLVKLNAPLISLDNASVSAQATETSQGQTGDINILASQAIRLNNHANISMKNSATIADPKQIIPTTIKMFAPNITLNNSEITTESSGNIDAGHIELNFSHWLNMNTSFITTAANIGDGGDITIHGGKLILLQDAGFFTSVSGANSHGGNIDLTANYLAMKTGVIQANAIGGTGGDIDLNLHALFPSYNRLILGGDKVHWQPFIPGFNVIQAASETGVSGSINVTSPQFDISASVIGLDSTLLEKPSLETDTCQDTTILSSTLKRQGQGGIPIDEAEYGFIPPAINTIPNNLTATTQNHIQTQALAYPCANL